MPNRPPIHRPPGASSSQAGARKLADRQRGSSSSRGYGRRWQRYRAWFLAQHPICQECGRAEATQVDHKRPVTGPDDPEFYEPENHTALCASCHSRKTASQDGGFGHRRKDQAV